MTKQGTRPPDGGGDLSPPLEQGTLAAAATQPGKVEHTPQELGDERQLEALELEGPQVPALPRTSQHLREKHHRKVPQQ